MSALLNDKVAASLTRYNMLSPCDRVGVAVSGGADSVALLHILNGLAKYQLVVLHVNHQLRGAESSADEAFVRHLAATLGLPIEVEQAPIGEGNMEQLARDARRAFFATARRQLNLRCIALGHNQTDQAETVLYRFLRGSGLAGLAAMAPVTPDGLIRPMLHATREEIRAWALEQGIVWREDSSNLNTDLIRNRLRLEVFNPQLVRVLSANAEVAHDEEHWWSGRIAETFAALAKTTPLGLQFSVAALRSLHPAEQRRVLRRAVCHIKKDLRAIDLSHIEAIRKLLESDAGHDRVLIPGTDALRSFGVLLLAEPGTLGAQPRHYRLKLKIADELALPYDGGRLYVDRANPGEPFCGNFKVEAHAVQEVANFDGEILNRACTVDSLHIRNWEPGDEYCRAGHGKSEKIKSLFQEFRILLWQRRRWPVLVIGDQIVWSRRFGAAAKFQATDESRSIVRLLYSASDGSAPSESNQRE